MTTLHPLPLLPILLLLLSSSLSSFLLPDIAQFPSPFFHFVPSIYFFLVLLVLLITRWRRPALFSKKGKEKLRLSARPEDEESGTSSSASGSGSVKDEILGGGLCMFGMVLGLIQARLVEYRVSGAIEMYTLSLLPLISTSSSTSTTSSTSLALSSTAFLTGLALIDLPSSSTLGLLMAFLRVVVDAYKWNLLARVFNKDSGSPIGGSSGQKGRFIWGVAVAAFLSSFILPILYLVLPSLPPSIPEYTRLLLYLTSTLLSQFLTLQIFSLNTSPIPALFVSIILRNWATLAWSSLEGGKAAKGWEQMGCVVLPLGVVGVLATNHELGTLLPVSITRWISNQLHTPSTPLLSSSSSKKFHLLPLLPLLLLLLPHSPLSPSPTSLAPTTRFQTTHTVDLVFSYYDEDLAEFANHVKRMKGRPLCIFRRTRVVVYNKGAVEEGTLRKSLELREGDEVVKLKNRGREGGTYLKHILSHYNSTLSSLSPSSPPIPRSQVLADHTFFLQPHLAWSWLAQPRLELLHGGTGFAHLGPYVRGDCGNDGRGNGNYPVSRSGVESEEGRKWREEKEKHEQSGKKEWWDGWKEEKLKRRKIEITKEIFNIFTGKLCPPSGQLQAWSAQFVVSRQRILANPHERYAALDEMLDAEDGHWIHQVWGPNQSHTGDPSNPAVGHALERAWPVIFGCEDPKMADECDDETHDERCQCRDY